jgi:hypothetical protein
VGAAGFGLTFYFWAIVPVMQRSVLRKQVLRARRTDRISIASPSDFVCGGASPFGAARATLFPYCIDVFRARSIYVDGVERAAVRAAPFYYLHLRRHAQNIVTVPIERGSLFGATATPEPIFLFSPGRCGSTLLNRLMFEAGISSVSEPDFYTQFAALFWSGGVQPLRELFRRAMWNMTSDLIVAIGGVPVVKLRAECCAAPELFLKSDRQRTLVMFRRFEDWARSTAQIFGAGPRKAVHKYMRALSCLAYLQRRSKCLAVSYESLLSDPEAVCAELGAFLGHRIDAAALAHARAQNSQFGSPLEAPKTRPGWEAKFDAAMGLWQSCHFARARDYLGVANVWD